MNPFVNEFISLCSRCRCYLSLIFCGPSVRLRHLSYAFIYNQIFKVLPKNPIVTFIANHSIEICQNTEEIDGLASVYFAILNMIVARIEIFGLYRFVREQCF